jgi:hypothetical protein
MSIGMSITEFLKKTGIALNVILNDTKALALLANFKIDAAVINGYIAIQQTANNAENTQRELHKRQFHACNIFNRHLAEAKAIFNNLLDLAKLALDGENHPIIALGDDVKKEIVDLRWMQKAGDFFDKILLETDLLVKLDEIGLTEEKLDEGLQKIIQAENSKGEHKRLTGEAQESIRKRNDALEALNAVMKKLLSICRRHAFKNHPQYLEKLGVIVLSDGYKRKVKPATEPTEPEEPEVPDAG